MLQEVVRGWLISFIFAGKTNPMIRYFENYSLKKLNTFGTEATARYFFEFTEPSDLQELIFSGTLPSGEQLLILGGGSNLLFVGDFDGWVLHPNIPGITLEREDRNFVWVRAGSGVVWDDFVAWVVREGWGGVENLSLIPGRVGAAPVQNIGAYGQEVSEVIESVSGIDLKTGEMLNINAEECGFGYRNSRFKQELKGSFVITSVLFRLDKFPLLKLGYQGIAESLGNVAETGVAEVREAVITIRRSKLPDPAVTGNAGSFFKNPEVFEDQVKVLNQEYPGMPSYPSKEPGRVKLSAGWLIDQCGWKGYRTGDAGVHERHALVLVNYGKATGRQIFELSEAIRQSVKQKFGVELEREVNLV
jgi:UDP-N-acetylmuramate dehydrogenase